MTLKRILPFSKSLLSSVLNEGDIAIDATIGNGHDTVFLAKLIGSTGHVYGFDIQADAIKQTKANILKHDVQDRVTIFQKSHADCHEAIPASLHGKINAAVFNLGYLPGGDKSIVTTSDSTIVAIEKIFDMLQSGGLIVLVIYHGHDEGKRERDALLAFAESIDQATANVLRYQFINQKNNPPFIIAMEKR